MSLDSAVPDSLEDSSGPASPTTLGVSLATSGETSTEEAAEFNSIDLDSGILPGKTFGSSTTDWPSFSTAASVIWPAVSDIWTEASFTTSAKFWVPAGKEDTALVCVSLTSFGIASAITSLKEDSSVSFNASNLRSGFL